MRAGLDRRGARRTRRDGAAWRLCLRLNEPVESSLLDTDVAIAAAPGKASKPVKPMPEPVWTLSFHLQAVDRPTLMLDVPDIWLLPSHSVTVEGRRVESPQELLRLVSWAAHPSCIRNSKVPSTTPHPQSSNSTPSRRMSFS